MASEREFDVPAKDDREDIAFAVVSLVLQAWIEPTDVRGAPQGTVDGLIHLGEGRKGALEISTLTDGNDFAIQARMRRLYRRVANPGQWPWTVSLRRDEDSEKSLDIAPKVIEVCERHGVSQVGELPAEVVAADPDLTWCASGAGPFIHGNPPGHPGADEDAQYLNIAGVGDGGTFERGPFAFSEGLDEALRTGLVQSKFAKLARTEADERHLFLHVTFSGLKPAALVALIEGRSPIVDPDVPESLDSLWLYSGGANKDTVTFWQRGSGWCVRGYQFPPRGMLGYDGHSRRDPKPFWTRPYSDTQR